MSVTVKGSKGQPLKAKVQVWNAAVANLTLMAVGTSAPEILLATIETVSSLGEPAPELGPACIIGSAAYNLLVISAVCIMAVPDGTIKKIEEYRVFVFTTICSIWAYVWMVICYQVWTPNVITLEEAFITFAFFPIMAVLAWAVDQRVWLGYKYVPDAQRAALEEALEAGGVVTNDYQKNNKVAPMPLSDQLMLPSADLAAVSKQATADWERNDPMSYRHDAVKAMSGARPIGEPSYKRRTTSARTYSSVAVSPASAGSQQVVRFRSQAYAVAKAAGAVRLTVTREGGDTNSEITMFYNTKDYDALGGIDYESAQAELQFAAGETYKFIEITLLKAPETEDDVKFFVCLSNMQGDASITQGQVEVSIINRVHPGAVCFTLPKYEVSIVNDTIEIEVERRSGTDGTIAVEFETQNDSAVAGVDYISTKGVLTFGPSEMRNVIRLPMHGLSPAAGRFFRVVLKSAQGGAQLGQRASCRVTATASQEPASGDAEANDWFSVWMSQLKEAIQPRYEQDENGNTVDVGILTCALHYITITWKVLMSIIPPAEYKGGYPCFFVALAFVAGITAMTEQSANIFGCSVGFEQLITGVSLVAMGTSLPDTFASRNSAISADTADAAIGNITGSNSVNVFLGLGFPWVIAAIYAQQRGEVYLTPAGDLSFSIIIFLAVAAVGFALLFWRRFALGGELGGDRFHKKLSSTIFLVLWVVYLILSGLRGKKEI